MVSPSRPPREKSDLSQEERRQVAALVKQLKEEEEKP
jgi:hypothetical protein